MRCAAAAGGVAAHESGSAQGRWEDGHCLKYYIRNFRNLQNNPPSVSTDDTGLNQVI